MDLGEILSMGGRSEPDPAETLREAAARGKLDRVDPNVVRMFVATYIVPLTQTLQKTLLEDPDSVAALEGRAAPITAAYIDGVTDEALADSDRALDVIAHAVLSSNGEHSATYHRWMESRSRAQDYLLATKVKFRKLAKDLVNREKHGAAESVWLWNFIDVGAVNRRGNSFTVRPLADAGRSAREYLRKRLDGPRRPADGEITVTVDE